MNEYPEISGQHAWPRVSSPLGLHSITTTQCTCAPTAYQCLQLVSHGQTNLASATYRCSRSISDWHVNWSGHTRLRYTAYVSLGLPGSLSQENYGPSWRAFQTSLYSWCPFTTLDTANACTILVLHVMIE